MKLERVVEELEAWGELVITTDAGEKFEIHIGDTEFDLDNGIIRLTTPQAEYLIDGSKIENIEKHYGYRKD